MTSLPSTAEAEVAAVVVEIETAGMGKQAVHAVPGLEFRESQAATETRAAELSVAGSDDAEGGGDNGGGRLVGNVKVRRGARLLRTTASTHISWQRSS